MTGGGASTHPGVACKLMIDFGLHSPSDPAVPSREFLLFLQCGDEKDWVKVRNTVRPRIDQIVRPSPKKSGLKLGLTPQAKNN